MRFNLLIEKRPKFIISFLAKCLYQSLRIALTHFLGNPANGQMKVDFLLPATRKLGNSFKLHCLLSARNRLLINQL